MKNSKQNEPLVTHIFTADPSAHVFEGKLYIYPSHDLDHDEPSNDNGDQYKMEDYHVLSMEDADAPCIDHGEVLHLKDIPWASKRLWARILLIKTIPIIYFSLRGIMMESLELVWRRAKVLQGLSNLSLIIFLATSVLTRRY